MDKLEKDTLDCVNTVVGALLAEVKADLYRLVDGGDYGTNAYYTAQGKVAGVCCVLHAVDELMASTDVLPVTKKLAYESILRALGGTVRAAGNGRNQYLLGDKSYDSLPIHVIEDEIHRLSKKTLYGDGDDAFKFGAKVCDAVGKSAE